MANTYVKIASYAATGSVANITFSSIPSTYTDLMLVMSLRSDTVSTVDNIELTFNGSTSTYSRRRLYGDGSSAASDSASSYTTMAFMNGNGATANTFSSAALYLPNYAGSTNKSFSIDAVQETNATATYMGLFAGLWATTSAISSINLKPNGGTNFLQYSTATLYGISKS